MAKTPRFPQKNNVVSIDPRQRKLDAIRNDPTMGLAPDMLAQMGFIGDMVERGGLLPGDEPVGDFARDCLMPLYEQVKAAWLEVLEAMDAVEMATDQLIQIVPEGSYDQRMEAVDEWMRVDDQKRQCVARLGELSAKMREMRLQLLGHA